MQRETPEDPDAVWRDIVDNYGDRPVLDDEVTPPVEPERSDPERLAALFRFPDDPEDTASGRGDRGDITAEDDEDEPFTPDDPPPVPVAPPDRLLAWLGVLGVPIVALVLVVLSVGVPSWFSIGLALGFVAGFGYLIFTMPTDPRDPWDDGSRI